MSFQELGLSDSVLHGIQRMGYVDPSPIQLRAIPVILAGHDLIASAQTGTGKTAAFGLPILSRLESPQHLPRCLILEPTRELAMQVETAFRDFARFMHLEMALIYGGVGYGKQKETLPKKRQTLLFSATVPDEIGRLAAWCLNNPEKIEIGAQRSPADTINHALYPVAADQKFDLLIALLERTDFHSVLIFSRTKDGADRIARQLKTQNHSVAVLHSNRTQIERVEALEGFKNGRYEVMVATDIAARGIDIAGVSHVINYDVPQHPEDYVHRIGRTGRAQNVGDAFTIMTAEELPHVKDIERFIAQKVPRLKLDNFDYIYSAIFNEDSVTAALKGAKGVRTHKGTSFGGSRKRRR